MNLEQETKYILNKYNAHANKGYGQNFLIDQNVVDGILEKAEVNKNEFDQYYNEANAHGKYNEIKDYWYILTKNDLQKIGIETDFADNDTKVFIVNYVTGEIIYTPGVDVKTLNPENGKEETKKVYTLRTFESL